MGVTRRYGSGTVYQRADGKWSGQWSAGLDETGRRLRRTVTAETEAAAWKAMSDARAKPSTRRRRGGETVGEFLERWLEDVVRPTRRERTLVGYRSIVRLHLVPEFGPRDLRGLSRRDVQAWVNRSKGSPVSVRHRLDCLRAALGRAQRWGLVDANPAIDIDLPAVTRRTVRAMRPEDANAVVAATAGEWFAPLVVVALHTGLRQGELLGLRWQDVDLRGRALTVHGSLSRLPGARGVRYVLTAPKSDASRRTVPLAPAAWAALDARKRAQMDGAGSWRGLVFAHPDRPIDGTALTKDFQAALRRAGLEAMRWHDLRHGTASLLIASGVPLAVVSAILGHSGIAITVDVYGHLTEDTKRAGVDRMAAELAAGG